MDKFIPGVELIDAATIEVSNVTDYTDVTGIVGIITVDFVESKDIDPATIPNDTATFATKVSGTAPTLEWIAEWNKYGLVWPEPAGGWDFVSLGASPTGMAYGYRVTATGGNFLGCKKFPLPIPISAVDQHIVLGTVTLPVSGAVAFD